MNKEKTLPVIDPKSIHPNAFLRDSVKTKQALELIAKLAKVTDNLTQKDIRKWRQAWQVAINVENPVRIYLLDIYVDTMIDLHLSGIIQQRKSQILQRKFKLVDDKNKEDQEKTKLFQTKWFKDTVDLALDSVYWGYTLIELGNLLYGPIMKFEKATLVPRKNVIPEAGVVIMQQGDSINKGIKFREEPYASWIIEAGRADDLGLLLKLSPHAISKKNVMAFWDQFAELFGMPIRYAETISRDDKETVKIENMLENMGSAAWGIFPTGTSIKLLESTKGDAFNVYDKRIDRANSEMSKGVLSQTLTTEQGNKGSQALGNVHQDVADDVTNADADFIKELVNDQIIPLMLKHGFPLEGYTFDWDDQDSMAPDIEMKLLDVYDVDPEYYIKKYNYPILGKKATPAGKPVKQRDDFFF